MESSILNFITNKNNYYLGNKKNIELKDVEELLPMDLMLYHIEEITFDEKAPRKEALENVLSSMRIEGINFIYLILGDEEGVHFYYGVAKDLYYNNKSFLSVKDIGDYILEPNIKGNFRGSKITEVSPESKREIKTTINDMNYFSCLEGVAGVNEDNEKFQGVDRLVDVMIGDEFGFMIIAKPINFENIMTIEESLNTLYRKIAPLSKKNLQDSLSTNTGTSYSKVTGESKSNSLNYSKSIQTSDSTNEGGSSGVSSNTSKGITDTKGTSSNTSSGSSSSKGTTISGGEGKSEGKTWGKTSGKSESNTDGTTTSDTVSSSITETTSGGDSKSTSTTVEFINKEIQDWIKYIDEVIATRLDYGKGRGIFNTTAFMFSKKNAVLKKLESTIKALFAGETGNRIPLQAIDLIPGGNKTRILKNFQIPEGMLLDASDTESYYGRAAISQYASKNGNVILGNWISTNELSLVAGLPQKEVVGLGLKEEVQFGLNTYNKIKETNKLNLGSLVHSGDVLKNIKVNIDKENLDKHVFITGVTGSGKTTTCQKILKDSDLPFLVIEPAKTEYRILAKQYDDTLIFTLGKDTVAPFRLNPFEFFEHESITSRVDMIKASLEAAFDMEAAIPQILESAIYDCYESYGWDISTNQNRKYNDPFKNGVYAFPTFSDLLEKVDVVVKRQGFDERLKNDYIGSIRARLQGLLIGSKGLMLDTKRSINFEQLLDRRVILELEEIRSGSEKSLVMGFVLINLVEAIKAKYKKQGEFNHITLVEEAHRLLSKFVPGDSPCKKQGVETFADMLAEIRKYGESLIIVDQIPNKLTPEVLKNTNTKIVHKIFAQDDKEAIGNTMILSDEQKEFLSNLEPGRAIVFSQGFNKAIQVQIDRTSDTTNEKPLDDDVLRKSAIDFYCENYQTGVIQGLECFNKKPTQQEFEWFIKFIKENRFIKAYAEFKDCADKLNTIYNDDIIEDLNYGIKELGELGFAKMIFKIYHQDLNLYTESEYLKIITNLINEYLEKSVKKSIYRKKLNLG